MRRWFLQRQKLWNRSKAWERFSDRLLWFDPKKQAGVADIRYPDVRKYLLDRYKRAVREWDIDGLKLDFLDNFYIREDHPAPWKEGMDFSRVEDALLSFLGQIKEELVSEKPDVMIEFRQWYVGPHMRRFSNMIRVCDCPGSAINNRIGIVDIRLLSLNTAVHSDMIMWHPEESVQAAARQIENCLFGNIQLSVRLARQSSEIREMIRFWMGFIKEKREILQEGELTAKEPQNLYPVAMASAKGELIVGVYAADHCIAIEKEADKYTIVNATQQRQQFFWAEEKGMYEICQRDCMGKRLQKEKWMLPAGAFTLPVTPSGLLELQKLDETPCLREKSYDVMKL